LTCPLIVEAQITHLIQNKYNKNGKKAEKNLVLEEGVKVLIYLWFLIMYIFIINERELLFLGQGNLYMSLNRPEGAVAEFKIAQDLRADIRSYQGFIF
jgi:hypothetical protein